MATTYYGRHYTQPHATYGWTYSGQLRGCVFDAPSSHLWAYELGGWLGRYDSSNVTTRIAVYNTDSSKNPTDRVGYSASFTVSAVMTDSSGGAAYTASVEATEEGPTETSIALTAGTRYMLAYLGTGDEIAHAMQESSLITADSEYFFNRTGLSQPPPDPFGSYSSSVEGHLTLWALCDINQAPETPTNLSPSGTVNDTAPTFSADFADFNAGDAGGTDRGDYLNQYKIQVRRVSDSTSFWDATYSASASEQTADAISRAYGGTTLVRGTAYEWRCQMSDHFGAWSSWTDWEEFTPASLGFVTLDGNPTSKIEDNTPDFEGRWNHQSATTMKTCMVRILNGAGTTVLQTGSDYDIADVASSAAPGTLFTIAWADSGLTTLAWGTSYQYQIRGYDGTQWSDWSSARSFNTDAAPSVPANLTPTGSAASSSLPTLRCTCTDADDTTGTGFVVYARIKNSGGTVLDTVTMTYNSSTGYWEYQITGGEAGWAGYATYKWDAYGYDGTIYSGEAASSAAATKSSEATFIYAAGPSITITAPTEAQVLTTSSVAVTWTVTNQQSYEVIVYADGTSTEVYSSGEIVSATGAHTVPSGYVRNDTAYDLVVWVEDTTPLDANSSIRNFSIDYTTPTSVQNVTATAVYVTNDPWKSAIYLHWDATAYGTDVWQQYIIRRSADSGVDEDEIILARITSPAQTSYTDYTPVSGIEYTYTLTQQILSGLDYLESDDVTATAQVDLGGIVLCDVSNPGTLRTALRHTQERDHGRTVDEVVYTPLSGATPTTVRSRTRYWGVQFDAQLVGDAWATAATRRIELDDLDAGLGTICYRDEKGRKYFCTMPDMTITDRVPDWYTAAITLREESYTEGVE